MQLITAFFANRAEVVGDMLNIEGGFWASTTVAPNAGAFRCDIVVLCDVDATDVGEQFELVVEAEGPNGRQLPAHTAGFTLEAPMKFMCMPSVVLPIDPGGGLHRYQFRLDGQHERIDVPLAVRLARP